MLTGLRTDAFVLVRPGVKYSYIRYDQRGKSVGYINVNVQGVMTLNQRQVAQAEVQLMAANRGLIGTTNWYFATDSAAFYADARQWITDLTKSALPAEKEAANAVWLRYPFALQPGDSLPSVTFSVTKTTGAAESRTTYTICNRRVIAADTVNLPRIGQRAALKLTSDLLALRPGMNTNKPVLYARITEWMDPRLGIIQQVTEVLVNPQAILWERRVLRGYKVQ